MVWHSVRHTHLPFLWLQPGSGAWFFDGVPLFFVMSGMLVYRSCLKCVEEAKPIASFYQNRFLRVGPALYAYALLTPIFLLAIGAIGFSLVKGVPFVVWFFSNILFCPMRESIFSSFAPQLNGSLWTIPVEVSFYLVCPLFVWVERKYGWKPMLAAVAALSLVGLLAKTRYEGHFIVPAGWWRADDPESIPFLYRAINFSFLPHLIFFGFGIMWHKYWPKTAQHAGLAVGCLAAYVLIRYEWIPIPVLPAPLKEILWGLPFSYFAVWLGYKAPAWASKITSFGDISYGTYIWHMVVVNTVIYLGLTSRLQSTPIAVHLIIYSVTFVVALSSWLLVERRALKLKSFSARPAES